MKSDLKIIKIEPKVLQDLLLGPPKFWGKPMWLFGDHGQVSFIKQDAVVAKIWSSSTLRLDYSQKACQVSFKDFRSFMRLAPAQARRCPGCGSAREKAAQPS